jgi:hypothetical protein
LKREKLVLDQRNKQQARANVKVTLEETLDELLPYKLFTSFLLLLALFLIQMSYYLYKREREVVG